MGDRVLCDRESVRVSKRVIVRVFSYSCICPCVILRNPAFVGR